jgi:adenine-specific DNA-methyltransferase
MINLERTPHLIKYMGAKREILDDINLAIKDLDVDSKWLCDLFSGTSIVSGAFKDEFNVHSNDIQIYSSIFANTYFSNLGGVIELQFLEEIETKVKNLIEEFRAKYPELHYDYLNINSFLDFKTIEEEQQNLVNYDFDIGFNFFTKYYSGTYWSFEQCLWIDSIRAVAEDYKNSSKYYAILSSLIFAVSYSSQSTGHFAQYRGVTESNMNDILIYRNKNVWLLFSRKFQELLELLDSEIIKDYKITTLDYIDCLRIIEKNSIVYADPPYSSVHYSRFYHAIETLVKYDHPQIRYKGRYRDDRHQSPFDKRKEVKDAFSLLFKNVKARESHLVLSYSDKGMITQEDILALGKNIFGGGYKCDVKSKEYVHSKMGRSDEHQMDVNELIISYKRK